MNRVYKDGCIIIKRKSRFFYGVYGNDALIFNKYFGYKLYKQKQFATGFPVKNLDIVLEKIDSLSIRNPPFCTFSIQTRGICVKLRFGRFQLEKSKNGNFETNERNRSVKEHTAKLHKLNCHNGHDCAEYGSSQADNPKNQPQSFIHAAASPLHSSG